MWYFLSALLLLLALLGAVTSRRRQAGIEGNTSGQAGVDAAMGAAGALRTNRSGGSASGF